MEINKLKTFVELASTLSFSKTATNLFINQSSVSKQIKSLERELNCELFIRAKRQIRMTEYAKILFPAAQKIIKLNDQALFRIGTIRLLLVFYRLFGIILFLIK